MGRIMLGIVAGLFAAVACIFGIEQIGAMLFPLPQGVDPQTAPGILPPVATIPFGAKALVVAGWCAGTLAGGAIAARLSHLRLAPWIVAGFVVAGATTTMTEVAHPGWMVAAGLILPWLCAWGVQALAKWRTPRP